MRISQLAGRVSAVYGSRAEPSRKREHTGGAVLTVQLAHGAHLCHESGGPWQPMRRRERERGGGADNPLPGHTRLSVLLSPPELRFCPGDPRTQRDVLTLYNPHAFALSYRGCYPVSDPHVSLSLFLSVQCTAPSLYSVVQAEGSVAPSSCVDIVVRHRDKTQPHCGHADRFRVEVRAAGGASGCREVPAVVGQEPPPRRGRRLSGRAELQTQAAPSPSRQHSVLCALLGGVCVATLALPLHGEPSSVVPPSLHVSQEQKLVCAYVLAV
ncbi:motile sperm domain-containing protein 1 isoform X2 [Amia ocellicauda]|uniref:motile sperm domain-containing protein 1 isoform X2 n=1 Tax=Amia ocellicauda TaxID=2972642 RepID=UPI003464D4DA